METLDDIKKIQTILPTTEAQIIRMKQLRCFMNGDWTRMLIFGTLVSI